MVAIIVRLTSRAPVHAFVRRLGIVASSRFFSFLHPSPNLGLKCGCVPLNEGYSPALSGIRHWSGRGLVFIYSEELDLNSLLA
jgi:hypothetical protein